MANPSSSPKRVRTLEGRVALVTGAAGGLGSVIAEGLLAAGASVVAADVSEKGLRGLSARLGNTPDAARLTTRYLNICDARACAAAVEAAQDAYGAVDILINNGALGMGAIREDHFTRLVGIEEIEPELWDRFMTTNVSGAWYLTRAVVPAMRRRRWGRIVNVTTSFFTMLRGRFHPYGPSKAALEAMSAGHAAELGEDRITVNVVVPGGPADTAMVPASSGLERTALIAPSKMVAPIVWLCSDAASGVTGKRFVAAQWDDSKPPEQARAAAEAPIAWPELATAPVWPGGRPSK